ncbi:MAG TPA: NADP-dependent phosphogluconate dehydrogenase [Polyangiaceae bacterium]|nr:NADP-dependent phosphogluconate dehydrogenase [Polyangiaceae bacterium]
MKESQIGVVGMAVMGRNLAYNISDHGYSVAVWNREADMMADAVKGTKLTPTPDLPTFVRSLERPRRILMMIAAGAPVDAVLADLRPLLEPGDIVIDGGNSWYEDTRRRERELAAAGLFFFGVGVSGGEEGARHGPSLMPGGDAKAYERIRPILEAIAARTDSGACVTHVGPDGAGHFVKMVHNGIEYADMQCIAEAYHLLRDVGGLAPNEIGDVFSRWNQGPLESFLIEITGKIFRVKDPEMGGYLVDKVLDKAGQKGTGKWTAQVALDLAVPIPSIAAAIDARVLSSMKDERVKASGVLRGPSTERAREPREALVSAVHDALYAAKICAYAQGMALVRKASEKNGWNVTLSEMARIWKGGCIIRARFLDTIYRAYEKKQDLANLLLDEAVRGEMAQADPALRRVVGLAAASGVPIPAMSASLAYYDSYRAAELPQNLTQAQRDAFGAHTYERNDGVGAGPVHSEWLAP